MFSPTLLLYLHFLVAIVAGYQYANLSYQAHGFNDLNYFLQQLVKGTNYFKIDLSEATINSCESYSTWNYDNECEELDYFTICCLGFRGDTSSAPIFHEPFNTTYDFIRLLNNTKYDFIWKKGYQLEGYNRTKYIAINFQYDHPLSPMTKNFLYNVLKTIEINDLNIQLITGTDQFINEYEEKCENSSCDFMEQYIADSNIILQSSAYQTENKRTQNFNVDFNAIDQFCNDGFPEWPDKYDIPYFFWEPSNEDTVKYVLNQFKSESCNKTQLHQNLENMKITSNLEPEMIEIFSKSFNNTLETLKIFLEDVKEPNILFENNAHVILFTQTINEKQTLFQIYEIVENQSLVKNHSLEVVYSEVLQFQTKKIEKKEKFLIFYSEKSAYLYFLYTDYDFILSLIKIIDFDGSHIISTLFSKGVLPFLFKMHSTSNPSSNSSLELKIYDIFNNQTVRNIPITLPSYISLNDLNNLDISSVITEDNFLKIILVYDKLVQPQNVSGLFGIIFELNETLDLNETIVPQTPFDFGKSPSVIISSLNNEEGDLMILEVHTDGLCQCGLMMNNNDFGKCVYHEIPEHFALLNTPYMMNYIWGKYEDFKMKLLNGEVINGCDSNLMHAKFNHGKNPKAALFSYNNRTQALIANEFVGYDDLSIISRFLCGGVEKDLELNTNSTNDAVIQSFSLTDSKIFDLLRND